MKNIRNYYFLLIKRYLLLNISDFISIKQKNILRYNLATNFFFQSIYKQMRYHFLYCLKIVILFLRNDNVSRDIYLLNNSVNFRQNNLFAFTKYFKR